MNDFIQGFKKGAKQTPLAYFAPAIAIWRLLSAVTESLMHDACRGTHDDKS
jgi:hypothetical protein